MDDKQQNDFSLFIESIKLKLASVFIKDITKEYNAINKKAISVLVENDTISQIGFEKILADNINLESNNITNKFENNYTKSIKIGKNIDVKYFKKDWGIKDISTQEIKYIASRSIIQSGLVVDNILSNYSNYYGKIDNIYRNLKSYTNFDSLVASEEFRNLSLQQKNLIRKNFDNINKRIKIYQQIKKENFANAIQSYSKVSAKAIGYFETASVIEKSRGDRASLEGANKKAWRSTLDNKTRLTHARAEGQTVNIDDYFLVANPNNGGIDRLRFPGDITAPISNTINCRCTVIYLD